MKKTAFFIVLIMALNIVPIASTYSQCSMCRQSAESGLKNGQRQGAGLNKGILYLMAIPYLMGAVGLGVYFYYRKHKPQ